MAETDELLRLRERIGLLEVELAKRVDAKAAEEYRYSIDLNPLVTWTANSRGRMEDFNQRWLDLVGLTREQALADGWHGVVHPEDLPKLADAWKRSLATARPYDIEHRIRVADGEYRWMRSRAFARLLPSGEIARWYGTTEDIHDNKQTELLLRESEQSFSAAFAEAPIGMVLLSRDGVILEANQAYREMVGYDLGDLTGKTSAGITHPDDVEVTRRFFETLRSEKQKAVIEKRYVHPDGHIIWTRASGSMRKDSHGRPVQVVAIVEDITARKFAEAERARLERNLRENEERLNLIFAQAPVGVCVLRGREMIYELVNPHYRELLPNRELLGHPLREVVPEVGPELLAILNGVLDTGEPFAATEFLIPLDLNGDGIIEDRWFNFAYHPLRSREGQISGVVAIALDVSSHVRSREELQKVNRELEEFAYVASHDLQEPLRMVNIYTEMLLGNAPTNDPVAKQCAGFIHEGVARMGSLIQDVLAYSRSVQKDEGPVTTADLSVSFAEAASVLHTRIEECGAAIEAPALPIVRGDTGQFSLVFQNLLSNALKYSRKDVPPSVTVSLTTNAEEWIIAVADNGIGFAPHYAERIFGLFKRLYKDEYPGTGLGLAICKRIVERYGGRIWATGQPGEGATFYIAVPRME